MTNRYIEFRFYIRNDDEVGFPIKKDDMTDAGEYLKDSILNQIDFAEENVLTQDLTYEVIGNFRE